MTSTPAPLRPDQRTIWPALLTALVEEHVVDEWVEMKQYANATTASTVAGRIQERYGAEFDVQLASSGNSVWARRLPKRSRRGRPRSKS